MPPNLVTGTEWYRRGAALGNTHCIINLGRHTALQDPAAGFALFEQAAALGNPAGHCYWAHLDKPGFEAHMLAAVQAADPWSLYCHGYYLCEKAQSDTERASHRHWIERAADLGEPAACQYLGVNSVYGRQGMAKDLDAACYWLRKGASLGCEECIYWLGRTRLDLGGDAALEGMVSLHHAAMLGVARAQTTLGGQMVWRSKTAQAQADGMLWLHAAAAQGHAYGCYLLAEALREGRGCEADPTGAAHWYQVGADKGDADCQAYLGLAYSRGDGVEKNLAKAHNLFSIASLQGGAWPTYLLGLSFENGSGTDKDPQAAIDCYTQAATAGESRAAYRLGLAYLRAAGLAGADLALATAGLGTDGSCSIWELDNVAVKPFPVCHFSHACADAAIALHRAGVDVARISRVEALVPAGVVQAICEPVGAKRRPQSDYDAKFSLPYAIACGLLRGRLCLEDLGHGGYSDPAALALMDRVVHVVDDKSTFPLHYSGELRLTMDDGTLLTHREAVNRGHAELPLSNAQVREKFFENAVIHFPHDHAQSICEQVLAMERLISVQTLEEFLARSPQSVIPSGHSSSTP